MIYWHLILDNNTFSCGRLISLSASIVDHIFYIYRAKSVTGMLSLINSWFLVLSTRKVLSWAIPRSQFYFYLYWSLEGRKKTFNSKTSSKRTCVLSAGLGIFYQASWTFAMSLSFKATGFYFFSIKSLTTKTICFGLSDPKSLRLSSRITSRISNCDPLKVPICWIQMLISRVCDMEKAKREFLRSIFLINYELLFFLLAN